MANWTAKRLTLGKPPEYKYNQNNQGMCKVALAETHRKRDQNGQWTDAGTSWYHATAFDNKGLGNDTAAQLSRLNTGDIVTVIEGSVKQRSWQDNQGQTRYDFDFIIDDFKLVSTKTDRDAQKAQQPAAQQGGWQPPGTQLQQPAAAQQWQPQAPQQPAAQQPQAPQQPAPQPQQPQQAQPAQPATAANPPWKQ